MLLLLDKNLGSFVPNQRVQNIQCQQQENEALRTECENLQIEEFKG